MLDKSTSVKVKNRDNGRVGYTIPDLGITRVFMPNEVKELTWDELQKLSYIPGGNYIIHNYFVVLNNPEVVHALYGHVEPEYYYNDEQVKTLLLNGSLDQLLDCLDFAPAGVIELVKKYAVELEINDLAKRNAIEKATSLNINKAIELRHAAEEDMASPEPEKVRRTAPVTAPEKKVIVRRAATQA